VIVGTAWPELFPASPIMVSPSTLLLDGVSNLLYRLSDLSLRGAKTFLHLSGGLIVDAFGLERRVIRQSTDALLHFALELFDLALHFILIRHMPSTGEPSRIDPASSATRPVLSLAYERRLATFLL
jgi:hypothetical protein